MILLSELSRRRIRSINKLIRVDRNESVVVLRVDKEKGYIDLSKRRVSAEESKKCEDKFNKGKAVSTKTRRTTFLLFSYSCNWPGQQHIAPCGRNRESGMFICCLEAKSPQDLEDLYKRSAWLLEKKFGGPSSSFDAFKLAITYDRRFTMWNNVLEKIPQSSMSWNCQMMSRKLCSQTSSAA